MPQNDLLMRLKNAYCERNGRILFRDVDLELSKGDLLHIEGPNGSGKTTLLRSLVGLFHHVQGDLKWFLPPGTDSSKSMFSYWGHRNALNVELSLVENLRWSVGLKHSITKQSCKRALADAGLVGYEDVLLEALSAGQQQRVGLARLALERMPVWILDEPLNALDCEGIRLFEERLIRHSDQGGCVLMTSHHALAVEKLKTLRLTVNGLIDSVTEECYQWS